MSFDSWSIIKLMVDKHGCIICNASTLSDDVRAAAGERLSRRIGKSNIVSISVFANSKAA